MRFPAFRPRAPWWGADLQTMRNFLRPPRPELGAFTAERLTLPLADGSGDRLSGLLQRPAPGGPERALVVLLHGLGGCEDSGYMRTSAAHWLRRGHPVLRLNWRGAGPSRPLCRGHYHAGRAEDLGDALAALPAEQKRAGLLLMGSSLGGNVLLVFLARFGRAFDVRAAAVVSVPLDLAASVQRIRAPRNRVYERYLLRKLRRDTLAPGAELAAAEARAVREAGSIYAFDQGFVAPRHGFRSAEDYYARSSGLRFLSEIRIPTLVIHARDDPWIPFESYAAFPWRQHPDLVPLLPERGGHVGFHGRDGDVPWHDACIEIFFRELTPSAEADSRVGLRAASRKRAEFSG